MDEAAAEAWRRLAEKAIGRGLETLTSRSADGVEIAPLYPRAPDPAPQPWRAEAAWSVAQRVDHPDAEAANRLALLDLEGGANALVLVGAESPYSRGFGAPPGVDLDTILAGVELDFISLRLDAGPETPDVLAALTRLVEDRRLTSAALAVDVGFDPIGWRARLGRPVATDAAAILEHRAKAGLAGTAFLADGRPWHEAGAGEAQELAAVLATAVAYLRQQERLGLTLDDARKNIAVLLAADADMVLGLAKFRAVRRLWASVESASGLEPAPLRLHAETSWRMMSRRDPWINVMRATAATFAAGLGGADVVNVLPFTLPLGLPDDGARRLARNLQHVLLEEAHLGKVVDPAAGAGSFETLTDDLARAAWLLFQEIEAEGGIEATIQSGALAGRIAATARERARDIASLQQGIIGTSRFASLDAPAPSVLDVVASAGPETTASALPCTRDAAPFEAVRDRADARAAEGKRPRVFLATLGPPAAFGPRATYAANFLAAAGLAADAGLTERDLEELVTAFKESDATVACLCGTDAAYGADAAALAKALSEAGARRILLAGPAIDGLCPDIIAIHDGCDALAILTDVLDVA